VRNFENVAILQGVSHLVSPRDARTGLRLSEANFPLDAPVVEFLVAHVASGLHDSQAKAARFVDRDPDRPADLCRRALGSETDLVTLSSQLANRLFDIATADQRQKDGTFVTLLCTATDGPITKRFVAMLKLDPGDAFHSVTDEEPETGKTRNRFAMDHNVLPTKGERLQKCAFVQTVDPDASYEMLVVDRLQEPGTVAKFWVKDFLAAEPMLDAAGRTKVLYRTLRSARNDVEQDLSAIEIAALDQVIAGTVVQRVVNLDTLVEALPVPEDIRGRIGAALGSAMPDESLNSIRPLRASSSDDARTAPTTA
jgi:nucleoid associated protein NdpA